MCNVSKLLKLILFADDTNIFRSHSDLPELVSEVNTELNKIYKWFGVKKLSLNIAKTNIIYYLADMPINKALLLLSTMLLIQSSNP